MKPVWSVFHTSLTGLHKISENSKLSNVFDETCQSSRDRFLDILGEDCMK
jgi:hypothetical protein